MKTAPRDDHAYRRSASRIGWQVMVVCAALVVIGGGVILGFVFWQTTPGEANQPPRADEIEVRLDPGELTLAVALLAVGAVICAGLAARLIARRAVRPLDEALQLQRRFVADVSHELRTPLAVLNARAQQLAALTPGDDPRAPVLQELRQDARIMSGVIDDLLDTATGMGQRRGSAPLAGTAAKAVQDLTEIAREFGVSLAVEVPQVGVAMPQRALLRSLIALLDNAIVHSPEGGCVTLTGATHDATVVITVADEGAGIEGIDPARVFDRFAHGSPSRTPRGRTRTKRGIGLALVRELCESHGGRVRVAQTHGTGTVFELTLPSANGRAVS